MASGPRQPAPDQPQRDLAVDLARSCLVQAPAGSGKTTLLTDRFLCLLDAVDDPRQVVAITFTIAAAAEMRHRIVDELSKEHPSPIAQRVLLRSHALGWDLLNLPAQLRISTIDSFCRELAMQQPLLSALGGGLDVSENPEELYRRAARRTLEQIEGTDEPLRLALEELLLARDNNWQNMEALLIRMLSQRDRWMHGFVLGASPDWDRLRAWLEQPFQRAVIAAITEVSRLLDLAPEARERALELARFACEEPGCNSPLSLAECAELPVAPFADDLESSFDLYALLACFLQTKDGKWRSEKGLKTADGFPSTLRGRDGKARFTGLIAALSAVPGLEGALARLKELPPLHYSDEEWTTVRACFVLLRHAAAQLQVVFAEAGAADFVEIAQIAQRVLRDAEGHPAEGALAIADGIRHLLVDEFQDTSRRQHQMLASLMAAWPDPEGRTCFIVGDPMQSIYFFRDADAELFPRVVRFGIELPGWEPFPVEFVPLTANFRTRRDLVMRLNQIFEQIFAESDGSGIVFSRAEAARAPHLLPGVPFSLHLNFDLQESTDGPARQEETALAVQTQEIIDLIRAHLPHMEQARDRKEKYRVAVLGRTRRALEPIALALREASIPFRAVNLEPLKDRPEVLDALNLARALLNAYDRIAWLGTLRAPWCGLALHDLHKLVSEDDRELMTRPVLDLLHERLPLLSDEARQAAGRVLEILENARALRAQQPTLTAGTWLEQIWLRLGGQECVDATGRANLNLLWQCLDALPGGDADLIGPALDAALERLNAQPDPAASSDCGVQLMTIHNSKGLEFEVVIVPDLQARCRRTEDHMLSWLERGLAQPDDSGEITEFLIAPLARKGADKGKAKAWVDDVYRERESQEMRRLLYVASTRAREELHLFARPACKRGRDGELNLQVPKDSLLCTAWPALGAEVQSRFEAWKAEQAEPEVDAIAASGEMKVAVLPAFPWLRRLPPESVTARGAGFAPQSDSARMVGLGTGSLYARHEGGIESRALGTAVHALLEELARLRADRDWPACSAAIGQSQPRIAAQVRALGLDPAQAAALAAQALQIARAAAADPMAQWILAAHPEAASEVCWAGLISGRVRTVRIDRIFQAALTPGSEGRDCWWVIDFKTAQAGSTNPAALLPELRALFAPQLEAYAAVLRGLHGADARIRAGLYYPRMSLFDWWEPSV